MKVDRFLFIFILLSIILDVTFHLYLGTHIVSVAFMLMTFLGLNRIFPSDNLFTRALTVATALWFYWIVFSLLFSLQSGTGLSIFTLSLLVSSVAKSIFGAILYLIGEIIADYTSGETKSTLKFR